MSEIWVGVDVSKLRLDVAVRPVKEIWSMSNDQAGIKELTGKLKKLGPQRIVLEATGGYEYELAFRLMKAGLPVAVVNPRQVRDFARAVGKLARTDPIDAKILAHFAETVKPPCRAVKDQQQDEVGHLVTRHRQLVEMIVAERNRRMSLRDDAQHDIDATILDSIPSASMFRANIADGMQRLATRWDAGPRSCVIAMTAFLKSTIVAPNGLTCGRSRPQELFIRRLGRWGRACRLTL
jgi:hypothetical protein